ncbi:MAG: TIGR00266 family protein [Bacteroides sp.]|nr:TIGR00266 family protein [Eubacterium sp.]MCM1419404.1 TIGR00266 family protein [Roseburia sp.]MCM1463240.1 TIGR00266 family protein [Bacteroides sp.]
MKYEIKGTPLPVLIMNLAAGEAVKTEKGAMSWMSPNMEMSTNAGGGVGKAFGRVFSGESMFQNIYTCRGGDGLLACASSFPGEILPIQVGGDRTIAAQKSAFLACESGVEMSIHFQKKGLAGFFGGEGFILQKFTGSGIVFLEIDGSVIEYTLAPGQKLIVDTGILAAMELSVSVDIQSVKGVGNALFGGEGLFNTVLTGPGRVWLQTMPKTTLMRAVSPGASS